ncbi:MAG: citrate (Si)-synthase [Ignavibacteria bacterium]
MSLLKEKLASQIPQLRERTHSLIENYGTKVISDVTVGQLLGGLRGVKSLLCDTSEVIVDQGLIIRGYPIKELTEKLPEEIYFLLLTGDLPTKAELEDLQSELKARSKVPQYLWSTLKTCLIKDDPHPMTILISCIAILERESKFAYNYSRGMKKDKFWEYALEDSLDLIAMLPTLAAGIYRLRFDKGPLISSKMDLDWAADFANMMGVEKNPDEFKNLMRLFMVLHCDHEGGNVSARTCHVVNSALADPYYSVVAGLCGLAGPLHGLANQEGIRFVLDVHQKFGGVPDDKSLRDYVVETLSSGRVIPGYGHAVLRVTDPRFTAFLEYGKRVMPEDDCFRIVEKLFEIVPKVLMEGGKAKNPWPNVDASSGALLHYFGITEFDYYTLLFGVSRVLGLTAQLILDRAAGFPIHRPKSVTSDWLVRAVQH